VGGGGLRSSQKCRGQYLFSSEREAESGVIRAGPEEGVREREEEGVWWVEREDGDRGAGKERVWWGSEAVLK